MKSEVKQVDFSLRKTPSTCIPTAKQWVMVNLRGLDFLADVISNGDVQRI